MTELGFAQLADQLERERDAATAAYDALQGEVQDLYDRHPGLSHLMAGVALQSILRRHPPRGQ